MPKLNFHKKLVLRTSLLPYTNILRDTAEENYLKNDFFLEALYISAPELYDLYQSAPGDKGIKMAILKYFLRASTRTTPFGLYAGVNTIEWSKVPKELIEVNGFKRITKLDIYCIDAICKSVIADPIIRRSVKFFPNTSIYKVLGSYRYIEAHGSNKFQLSSFDYSSLNKHIFSYCRDGKTLQQLIDYVAISYPGEENSIMLFLEEMLSTGILTSELVPNLIGTDPLQQLITSLEQAREEGNLKEVESYLSILREIEVQLDNIDKQKTRNRSNYIKLKSYLKTALQIDVPLNKIINVTMFPNFSGGLDKEVQGIITDAIEVLSLLTKRPQKNEQLQAFISDFSERYETQQKSLLEVLDQENGIGYSDVSVSSEMLQGLIGSIKNLTGNSLEHPWDQISSYLLNKVIESQRNGIDEIRLDKAELSKLTNTEAVTFDEEDLSILFRSGDGCIFLENAVSSGTINTITRFAVIDEDLKELALEFSPVAEDIMLPIYAEISHYAEPTTGNILRRPRLTKYQICIIYHSGIPSHEQIPLNDLLISLRENKVVLQSRRLKREVIPVLTSAHNFHHNRNLPIYRFLCDLQMQSARNALSFNWPIALSSLKFFPRVTYKSSILSLSSWNFRDEDLVELIKDIKGFPDMPFMKKWSVPTQFVIAEGDNELFIDIQEQAIREVLLKELSKRSVLHIKEVFLPGSASVISANGKYANQFLAFSRGKKKTVFPKNNIVEVTGGRAFYPLGEWIYFKLYCGGSVSDEILIDTIEGLTNTLSKAGLIDKWFFIRYKDPAYHLRIRLHAKNSADVIRIIDHVNKPLKPLIIKNKVWKIQFDTYKPELERYSLYKIDISESAFHISSFYTLKLLKHLKKQQNQEQEKIMLSMASVDNIFSALNFDTRRKLMSVNRFKKSLENEYSIKTDFWKKIDSEFRENKSAILKIMDSSVGNGSQIRMLMHNWKIALEKLYDSGNNAEEDLESYLFSMTHMQVNRLFKEHQKINELITYQMLSKYYSLILYSKTRL